MGYSPLLGRWMQQDPIAGPEIQQSLGQPRFVPYPDGMNLYEYVRGGPLDHLDFTGLIRVRVDADAFIPQAWLDLPTGGQAKGDNRDVSPIAGMSSRIANWIEVELDASVSQNPEVDKGASISPSTHRHVDPDGKINRITRTGRNTHSEVARRVGPCEVLVTLYHQGFIPFSLQPGAPAINYQYLIRLCLKTAI